MQKFNSVDELVNTIRPVDPIYCIRPNSVKSACGWFKKNFPGKILYAVKTNPNEKIIKCIGESGINQFDVASINEIKLIKKIFPKAHAYYMNTVKSREHIQEAYFNHNIRDFVLDTKDELQKIIEATNNAKDVSAAEPIAKPLPIAAVVFPRESSLSVIVLTSGPNFAISAIPPALSAIGPYASTDIVIPIVESILTAAIPIP